MRYLLSALLLPLTSLASEPPRAAYVCEALILNKKIEASFDAGALRNRLGEQLRRAMNRLTLERQVSFGATVNRMREDLAGLRLGRVAVRQELVGEEAIRGYLEGVRADASRLEAAHDANHARQPHVTRPALLKNLAASLAAIGVTGVWGYLTAELIHTHHPVWAAVTGFLTFRTALTSLYPFVTNVVQDIRNVLVLRAHARGGRVDLEPSTAGVADEAFAAFADEVLTAIADSEQRRDTVLWATSRVALPLSRSTASFWLGSRMAPTAGEIEAAVKRSGDFRLPADARVLDVDHAYFYDFARKEPVLLTLVRERSSY